MSVCQTCGTHFPNDAVGEEYDQSHGCSATVFNKNGKQYIIGHYGSRVADCHLYAVTGVEYKENMMCDDCITTGLANKNIEKISEDNYFDFGDVI